MDNSSQTYLNRDAQFTEESEEAFHAQIDGRLKDLHTFLPGVVISWDGAGTVVVQPVIQRLFTEQGAVNLPPCLDVPVSYPGAGNLWMTFPIELGAECLLAFSERAIDFWYEYGGIQLPAIFRHHDLSDAVAIFGLNSKPNVLPNIALDGIALRTRDNSKFVKVGAAGITILGDVTVTGNLSVVGGVTATADVVAAGISMDMHTHPVIGSNTGVAVG